MEKKKSLIEESPWQSLRRFTQARIALGRCGCSIPTKELLAFKLAHARAVDAVHLPLDIDLISRKIRDSSGFPVIKLKSAVVSRREYLQRPDLGRILSVTSENELKRISGFGSFDLSLVVADGLSSKAISCNILSLLHLLIPELKANDYRIAPLSIVEQARVAIGDSICRIQRSKMVIVFIGERPGLKSPDSMGIYLTYHPVEVTTDDRRNCISNVRPQGLSYSAAVQKLLYLIHEAFRLQLSGVHLKDNQPVLSKMECPAELR